MDGVLVVERIILESLSNKMHTILEISKDTGLCTMLTKNVLANLQEREVVIKTNKHFFLNKENSEQWLSIINSKENIKEEVKEIFVALINQHFKDDVMKSEATFKMQKIWLNKSEEKTFSALIYNIETFIESVKEYRKKYPQEYYTGKQKVIFWGMSNYASIVDGIIQDV